MRSCRLPVSTSIHIHDTSRSKPAYSAIAASCRTSKQASLRMKTKAASQQRSRSAAGGFGRSLKEQRSKVYIAMRCVVMLLRWHD